MNGKQEWFKATTKDRKYGIAKLLDDGRVLLINAISNSIIGYYHISKVNRLDGQPIK